MSSLRSGRSFLGVRATPRTYMTPAEKRQHYIAEFLSKIRQGDPECAIFSPAELVDLAQELRENSPSSLWLYDHVVKKVVDEGVFLDPKTKAALDAMEKVKVTEEDVTRARRKLEIQEEMQRLTRFTEKYLQAQKSNQSSEVLNAAESRLTQYTQIAEKINSLYTYHNGAKGFAKKREMQDMMTRLRPLIIQAIQQVQLVYTELQTEMEKKICHLTVKFFEEESNEQIDFNEFVEQNPEMAECCHQMQALLHHGTKWMTKVEHTLKRYQRHQKACKNLVFLRNWVRELAMFEAPPPEMVVKRDDGNSYESTIKWLDTVRNQLSFEPLIDNLQHINTALVVMEAKLAERAK